MTKRLLTAAAVTIALLAAATLCKAQENGAAGKWDLARCINYALENNIQIKMQELSQETAEASLAQAVASQYPTLNFSAGTNATLKTIASYNEYMEASKASMSGNVGLNSGMTLYQGGKLRKTIAQQQLSADAAELDVEQQRMDIEISVAQAYLQVLFNNENLEICRKMTELDELQLERGEKLLKAGSISKVDLAQLKSQYASDKYQLVSAANALSVAELKLKQLLEIGLDQEFEPAFPEIGDNEVYSLLPSLQEIYDAAKDYMPQVKSTDLDVQSSQLGVDIAKASALPSISMSAGVSTGVISGTQFSALQQLGNKLGESVGLNLSVPIFNGRQVRTNVRKAEIQYNNALLQQQNIDKQLLSTLESLRNDAVSAQQKYSASKEKLAASEAAYELVSAQFNVGAKNVLELTTEKTNYISALSDLLQAKYQAVLAVKLLDRYMGTPIEL